MNMPKDEPIRPPNLKQNASSPKPVEPTKPATPPALKRAATKILIELFVADTAPGYVSRHVQVGGLSLAEGAALRRLQAGLLASGVALKNGRAVVSTADTLRWLLQQVAAEVE